MMKPCQCCVYLCNRTLFLFLLPDLIVVITTRFNWITTMANHLFTLPPQPNPVHFKLKSNFHGHSLFHTFVPLARLIPLNTKYKFKDHNCVFANDASSCSTTCTGFYKKMVCFRWKWFIIIYIYDWILK